MEETIGLPLVGLLAFFLLSLSFSSASSSNLVLCPAKQVELRIENKLTPCVSSAQGSFPSFHSQCLP
ncbi:uncharacterized protein FFMR_08031 [Fusarium fujikuroi]|nr:uncharacterized protein FFMR_08031 [Fusarium fujikuroi]SCV44823.1 uncharacterized protein FFFS_07084 [Fusarium fujikuroi]